MWVNPPLAQCMAFETLISSPEAHLEGECLDSQLYLNAIPSRNLPFVNLKLYVLIVLNFKTYLSDYKVSMSTLFPNIEK